MIQLTASLLHQLEQHSRAAYPSEGCGVLIGAAVEGGKRVHRLLPVENASPLAEQYHRYVISPPVMIAAERKARAAGLAVIGFYHSHPEGQARPSDFDREHAWPWYSYLVVGVQQGKVGETTAWLLSDNRESFDREEVIIERV